MKKPFHFAQLWMLLLTLILMLVGCSTQETPKMLKPNLDPPRVYNFPHTPFDHSNQISTFVRRIYQDADSNLWFGSNSLGVSRYDGDTLVYFTPNEGFAGYQVTGIVEDNYGDLWFSTNGGVSRFNGNNFTNFTTNEGLESDYVWSIYADSRGNIWAGTLDGLSRGDGKRFYPFPLPEVDIDQPVSRFSTKLVSCITEDSKGDMWFGTDGVGVCVFDGQDFRHFTTADGLCDNNIVCIIEDSQGNMWFGSRFGGVSMYDGKRFTNFTVENGAIGDNETWNVFEDSWGFVWFASEGFGVYRYKDGELKNFDSRDGLYSNAVQCIYEDLEGRIWIGGYLGLYQFDRFKEEFTNVKKNGPWRLGC